MQTRCIFAGSRESWNPEKGLKDFRKLAQEKGQQMDIVMDSSELICFASEMSLTLGKHKVRFHPDSGIKLDGKPIETK